VPRIHVLVAATSLDLKAEGISAAIAQRRDMELVESRVVEVFEIEHVLSRLPPSLRCALVLVGPAAETEAPAATWVERRKDLVVLRVDILEDVVRIAMRDIGLEALLAALRALVDHAGSAPSERVSRIQLRPTALGTPSEAPPLLAAAIDWAHAVLRSRIGRSGTDNGDLPGLTVSAATLADLLDSRPARTAFSPDDDLATIEATLTDAWAAARASDEPLARAVRALELTPLEFRLLALVLAPELDPRYQSCIGLLLDNLGRRNGTLSLFAELLGEPTRVRHELAAAGHLSHWRVFDGHNGATPAADDPLRLDPFLCAWLLGDANALSQDLRLRRGLRLQRWRGAGLLVDAEDHATRLFDRLLSPGDARWVLLENAEAAYWRALLELGADTKHLALIRSAPARLAEFELSEVEETGLRLARMARLTGAPLTVDATDGSGADSTDDVLRAFLAAIGETGHPIALIGGDVARLARLLGSAAFTVEEAPEPAMARIVALRTAAARAEAPLSDATATAIAGQFPLSIDGIEQAMHLALARPLPAGDAEARGERFLAACKAVAAEGISQLVDRIEPAFRLDEVVLPPDRKQQLDELVDNVRLAPTVLDGWKFREQMPYGRGVTALFHGPSGTGKTMAAIGVAQRLGVQLLRIDLSRVVSKYIGDTEKNIDRVFFDAQASGAALLFDEADALMAKRSEVNDAHDRYANIEVAYLLQRMEAFEGLAILTTNLRQNLDPAFLRRLRFIVDFPRPDIEAREIIWRQCLPDESHALNDIDFRHLARKIELTGGHVRQITLRAAFIAAGLGIKIGVEHIARASRAEFAKLGLPPVDLDTMARQQAA
jgi:hypothetical protein